MIRAKRPSEKFEVQPVPLCVINDDEEEAEEEEEEEEEAKSPLLGSWRLWTAILVMTGMTELVHYRMSLSMALVCMVAHNYEHSLVGTEGDTLIEDFNSSSPAPFFPNNVTGDVDNIRRRHPCHSYELSLQEQEETVQNNLGTFNWTKEIQGQLLSSYFYGFCPGQLFGGWACDRWGGRLIMMLSVGVSAILTLFNPAAAHLHPLMLLGARIGVGFIGGFGMSCTPALLSSWGSPDDQALLLGIAFIGFALGTMTIHPLISTLCLYGPAGGWPSAFYTLGIMGILWVVMSYFLLYNSPAAHPYVSRAELRYLAKERGFMDSITTKSRSIPWRKILTSRAIWISIATVTFCTFGYFAFVLHQPIFMRDTFGFLTDQNGWMSSLPWIVEVPVAVAVGAAVDRLKRTGLSITTIRKIFNTIGYSLAASVLVIAVEADCDMVWIASVSLILVEVGNCMAFVGGTYYISVDLAPAYSATTFGLMNTGMGIQGFIAPIVVAWLTPMGTREEWRVVFWVGAMATATGVLLFLFWGTAEALPWAVYGSDRLSPSKDDVTAGTSGMEMEMREQLVSVVRESPEDLPRERDQEWLEAEVEKVRDDLTTSDNSGPSGKWSSLTS